MVAGTNQTTLPDREGRLVHHGGVNEISDVLQGIQLFIQLAQKGGILPLQAVPQFGQTGTDLPQGSQIAAVGRAVHDTAGDALHVIDAAQQLFNALPQQKVVDEGLHRTLAAGDLRHVQQGFFQPLTQHTGTHGGAGLVQHPQKAALFLAAVETARQLQIAAGGVIQLHKLAHAVDLELGNIGKIILLGFMQIGQQTAHRTEQKLLFGGNFLTGKLLYSSLFCCLFQKAPLPCPLGIGVQPILCKGQNISAAVSPVGQQQLPGRKPPQLAQDLGLHA